MSSEWTKVGSSKDGTDFNNGQYLVNNTFKSEGHNL